MLGTHLISNFAGSPASLETAAPPGLEEPPFPRVVHRLIWQDRHSRLSCAAYAQYPVSSWENRDFFVHLEGRIYNATPSRLGGDLLDLAAGLFREKTPPASFLCRWLLQSDGDFLLVLVSKADGRLAVLNDVFAHLPAYYCLKGKQLILSRSLQWITRASGAAVFDPMALALYLLLGFPPGRRTWFSGIEYLPPGSLITVSPGDASVRVDRLHDFNLEGEEHASKSSAENAANLADLFRRACRRRAGDSNVVSLSGGLDSRAVAAGLAQEGIPLAAASFLDHRGGNAPDVRIAGRVAGALSVPWQSFSLAPPRGRDLDCLLALKDGLNNLRMSFILSFFRQLQERFGPGLNYFTGDGGGDTLGDSRPYRRVGDKEALLDYLIERYQVWPLDAAAALTRLPARDIKEEVAALLASYPEGRPERQYKHFFCLEVATRMYHEGEDRNRRFFWSVTPFYDFDFFHYALNCPDRHKRESLLYRLFLDRLHPAVAGIDYADWGAPVASLKYKFLYHLKSISRIRPHLVRRVRKAFRRYDAVNPSAPLAAYLRQQSIFCEPLSRYLDPQALARVLKRPQDHTKLQFWTLLTLASTIAAYTCPPPLGEDFLDRDFV